MPQRACLYTLKVGVLNFDKLNGVIDNKSVDCPIFLLICTIFYKNVYLCSLFLRYIYLLCIIMVGGVAFFSGSFDPFTRGHAAIVEQSLRLFDRVVIGVGVNINKSGFLAAEERLRLIEELYRDDARVEVRLYSGLTGDEALMVGATALVRGVRNTVDFELERTMESMNRRLYPQLQTVLLMTPAEVSDISSSCVRELLAFGREVDELMPEGVEIKKYLAKR